MLFQLCLIMLPILVCAGIGIVWVKLKLPFDTRCLVALITNIGIPSLLLSSLTKSGLTLAAVGHTFVAGGLAILCFIVLGLLALKLLRIASLESLMPRYAARQYLPALSLPNSSNLGLPIAYFAFGEESMIFAIAFSTLVQISHATFGLWLVSGHMSPRKLATNPIIYALVLALVLIETKTPLPQAMQVTVKQLGGMTVPLMLMLLGASLAEINFKHIARPFFLAVVRVAGGFGIGLALAALLHLPRVAAGTFVIQCAMPVAVLSYIFAKRYDGPSQEIAATIFISTVLALASLPFILSIVAV